MGAGGTRVVATDVAWPATDVEREVLGAAGAEFVLAERGDEQELLRLVPAADAILTCFRRVSARVLDAAVRCRTVARYGTGVDNIDVARATELGMVVTNVPDYCTDEVADHAFGLVLALARQLVPLTAATRAGRWDGSAATGGVRLNGRTLGIVGLGAIGRAVAARAAGFGMATIACTRPGGRVTDVPAGVEVVAALAELLERADVVTLHLPLSPDTRGLLGRAEFARMKPGALLVNTARGGLLDSAALLAALEQGRLGGAALDVLDGEPPRPDHPLLGRDDVIVTPHTAFASAESMAAVARRAADNVVAVLRGQLPATVVNRPVLERADLRA